MQDLRYNVHCFWPAEGEAARIPSPSRVQAKHTTTCSLLAYFAAEDATGAAGKGQKEDAILCAGVSRDTYTAADGAVQN